MIGSGFTDDFVLEQFAKANPSVQAIDVGDKGKGVMEGPIRRVVKSDPGRGLVITAELLPNLVEEACEARSINRYSRSSEEGQVAELTKEELIKDLLRSPELETLVQRKVEEVLKGSPNKRKREGITPHMRTIRSKPEEGSSVRGEPRGKAAIVQEAPTRGIPKGISPWKETLGQLFVKYRKMGLLQGLKPYVPPTEEDRANFCVYHVAKGHRTNNCPTLRDDIQRLIDIGAIEKPIPGSRTPNEPETVKEREEPAEPKGKADVTSSFKVFWQKLKEQEPELMADL